MSGKNQKTSHPPGYVKDLRRIHVGARAIGMDSDSLHLLLENMTGKSSLTKTTARERGKIIAALKEEGAFKYKKKTESKQPKGSGSDMITERQQWHIDKLFCELATVFPLAGRKSWRMGFIKKIIGSPWPQKK